MSRHAPILVLLVVWLFSAGAAAGVQDDYLLQHMLVDAEVVEGAWSSPPQDAAWRAIALPDIWRHSDRSFKPDNAWYRFRVSRPAQAGDPYWGLYLLRHNLNAGIWFNGQFLGDGGRFAEPVARNWNRPMLWRIPAALWREGENELLIRLRADRNRGVLAPPLLAPYVELQPLYEARLFRQITLSQAGFIITLAIAVLMFSLWLRRRRDRAYLWFALSNAAWALLCLHLFVRDIPVNAELWWKSAHVAIDAWAASLLLFSHRLAGVRRRWLDRLAIASVLLGALIYSFSSLDQFIHQANRWHLIGIGFTAYLVLFNLYQGVRQKRNDLLLVGIGMATLFGLAVHDWLLNTSLQPADWLHGYHLLPQGAPLIFAVMTWHLTGRFIQALNQAEELNASLEQRVASARRELAQSYEQRRELEREQAATEERQRIYSDLHDDLGAKLLSLVYRADRESTADLARSALQDLRDVVSRTDETRFSLGALLSDWRSEAQQRLDLAGVQLQWRQPDDALLEQSSSSELAFHLGRVLREAVSNILKHAQASEADISVEIDAALLRITIRDNGRGCLGAQAGRGISNMHKRIADLHGDLRGPESQPQGCRIIIELPLPDAS